MSCFSLASGVKAGANRFFALAKIPPLLRLSRLYKHFHVLWTQNVSSYAMLERRLNAPNSVLERCWFHPKSTAYESVFPKNPCGEFFESSAMQKGWSFRGTPPPPVKNSQITHIILYLFLLFCRIRFDP